MLNDFKEIISQLEEKKAAIDKAIDVLRGFDDSSAATEQPTKRKYTKKNVVPKKRVMSEEGRKRIAEATRKRWAAVRKAAKQAKKAA
jgi:hypothetical protein